MSKGTKILFPIILSLAIALGIILGVNIQARTNLSKYSRAGYYPTDKLSSIMNLIENDYVDSVNKAKLTEEVIPGILEHLDPHTSYIPAKEMVSVSEEMRGNFSGIGVQFVVKNDTVMVVDVVSGGPSQRLGILAGDRITKVNDNPVIGFKSDSIVSLLRGKKDTHVKVGIQRQGFLKTLDFDIVRGEIPLFSIDVAYIIGNNIGFIKVNRFAETTYKEFVKAMESLKENGATKLIIDLRGNSGGYLQLVFKMVDEFLPANKMIVYTQGKARPREDYLSSSRGMWTEGDVAVLIDEYSASASEIFAGAIQDNDRGIIVGRRSFGKGLVQEQIPFVDGSSLRLTVARFYTPSGRSIQKPYDDGIDAYYHDLQNRVMHDEFTVKDSIHFNDSLKYYTVGGRMVYGGGGIMPDFFVPADTSGINGFFTEIASKNLIYRFAFDYADVNRKVLNKYKTPDHLEDYLVQVKVLDKFLAFIKKEGIKEPSVKELNESEFLIAAQLYAYIGRNIQGDNGFYPIIFKIDNTVNKAVELLMQDWAPNQVAHMDSNGQ